MREKMEDKIWPTFRDAAIKTYGLEQFNRVSGRYALKDLFDRWLPTRMKTTRSLVDVEDAAEDFLEITLGHFERSSQSVPKDRDCAVAYPLKSGSLQSIVAYAEALPIVLRARQDVLGRVEPLSREEAEQWLERETSESTRTIIEVTYQFSLPRTVPWLSANVVEAIGRGEEVISLYEAVASPSGTMLGIRSPSICPKSRLISLLQGERAHTVDLLECRSPKAEALARWADRLADRCVGEMALDSLDQPRGFEWAVWLILAGIWPRITMYGIKHSSRDRAHSCNALTHRRQAPYIAINVLALDVPHEEVASTFQQLRARAGLSGGGPKMSAESEILCLAALETIEIDGFGEEDTENFRRAVLERYSAKARMHGVNPDEYGGRGGWKKAARVLKTVAEKYRNLYARSTFPVQTPDGPRTLVSEEPDLFSRDTDPVKLIVK